VGTGDARNWCKRWLAGAAHPNSRTLARSRSIALSASLRLQAATAYKSGMPRLGSFAFLLLMAASIVTGCGDDDHGLSDAQRHGVGASCTVNADCYVGEKQLVCLGFKGGYCGLEGCTHDSDCPAGSACVAHDDGKTYCFLICSDKPQCNATRPVDVESNCSSSITFVDNSKSIKACVPPS
jgi:hypothetical protein